MSRTVGILGYQGCIEPHEAMLRSLGVHTVRVRTPDDLSRVDRLILPGGESTTMLRFLEKHAMAPAIVDFAGSHLVWGICAGAILAARAVTNPEQRSLGLIDVHAHRNFYGSQLESFSVDLHVGLLDGGTIEAQFIRAPLLSPLPPTPKRPNVEIQARHGDQPVLLTQGRVWASSFHVELGTNPALHQRFLDL